MNTSNITSPNRSAQAGQNAPQKTHDQSKLTPAQQQQASLKVSILKSTQASIGVKDQPLSLLLNTAIDKLNEILAPELGDDAIQKAADSGLDVSPEATAERIVSLSTALYSAYKEQKPEEAETQVLENFMSTIGSGIEKGFNEARDILEALEVLEGKVASDINETYKLVQNKLSAFETMMKEQITG